MTTNEPLRDFLKSAIDLNYQALEMKDAETWQSAMFTFVRIAKSHPRLSSLSAVDAAAVIAKTLKAAGIDLDASFDSYDPIAEIVATWERVQPIDGDPVSLACLNASLRPVTPLKTISKTYTTFLSIAYHLQKKQASEPILLPVAKLGKLLGVDFRTISFYRKIAQSEGLLEHVGDYSYKEKLAAQFFFNVRLFEPNSLCQMGHWNQDKQDHQDKQDLQDKQDFQDSQELHDKKDKQEFVAAKNSSLPSMTPPNSQEAPERCAIKPSPSFIPSAKDLEEKKRQAFELAKQFSTPEARHDARHDHEQAAKNMAPGERVN